MEKETSEVIDSTKEKGYVLYDLVQMFEEDNLGSIDKDVLLDTNPHVISLFLSRLTIDMQRMLLRKLPEDFASEVVAEMNPEDSADLLAEMRESRAVSLLNEMEPDDAADLVGELDKDDRERILGSLEKSQPETAETVRELLEYHPDTAGGLMNPSFVALQDYITVDEAIDEIRRTKDDYDNMHYLYVLDKEGVLDGVISMRNLVLASKDSKVKDIMNTDLIGLLSPSMDKEVVAQIMADTNFHTLPVIDDEGKLLGLVTHDDILDVMRQEGTEDMQMLAGAGADESLFDSLPASIRMRAPWLVLNLATAFLASSVVGVFQADIAQLALLAVFMPIIAGIGGNTGAQTLSITVRSLALGEVGLFDAPRMCIREASKAFANSILIGLLGAVIAFFTTGRLDFAIVVYTAMVLNMTMGGFVGCAIPFALKRFNLDPAAGSSIFTTGATDTGGFLIFLGIGSIFLV